MPLRTPSTIAAAIIVSTQRIPLPRVGFVRTAVAPLCRTNGSARGFFTRRDTERQDWKLGHRLGYAQRVDSVA